MYLVFNTTITFYTVILLEFCFRVCSTLHHRSSNSDQRFLLLSDCDWATASPAQSKSSGRQIEIFHYSRIVCKGYELVTPETNVLV